MDRRYWSRTRLKKSLLLPLVGKRFTNKYRRKLHFKHIAVLFIMLFMAACNSASDQVKNPIPAILSQHDFAYWSWEPKVTPASPGWQQVVPPEDLTEHFVLAGYAGDKDNIMPNEDWSTDCHSAPTCTQISYTPDSETLGWAGNLWVDVLYPKYSQGIFLEFADGLTFWAKGENGGEQVEFRVGSTEGITPQPAFSTGTITLQNSWQPYTIEFTSRDHLDRVFSGFSWLASVDQNPQGCTFYLDDIQFK